MNIKKEKKHDFIKSLILLTKKNMIVWLPMRRYLDRNRNYQLQDYIVNVLEEKYKLSNHNNNYLRLEKSFVTTVKDSIIFLLWIDGEHTVFVQNSVETKIQETSFSSKDNHDVKLLLDSVQDNISSEEFTIEKVVDLAKDLDDENF
jgi:hypothetical protein